MTGKKRGPKGLNKRQEAFIREYFAAGCQNALAAARAAGYAEAGAAKQSFVLMQHPEIKAQIGKLKKRADDKAILSANETLAKISDEARNMESNSSSRIKALELMAKYWGLLIERQEVGKPGEFATLSNEELDEEIDRHFDRRPEKGLVM